MKQRKPKVEKSLIIEMCKDPLLTYQEIANKLGISQSTVYNTARDNGIVRPTGRKAGKEQVIFKQD